MKKVSCFYAFPLIAALLLSSTAWATPFKSFNAFEANFEIPRQFREAPEYFNIMTGYAEVEDEPPGVAFMLKDLPKKMFDVKQAQDFDVMGGFRHQVTNYSLITHDPLGKKLDEPFALGDMSYILVKSDSNQGIEVSVYYYNALNVDWKIKNEPTPSEYVLDEVNTETTLTIPSDTWLIINVGKREETTIRNSKKVKRTLYRYFFIKPMRM